MKPHEIEIRRLVEEWIDKAELDFSAVVYLAPQERFRDLVAFHAQQAAEKFLKALLTHHQIEFPKTHLIHPLLNLLASVEPELAATLEGAVWLGPFGVEIRYPGDTPETLPGDERRATELAAQVREAVLARLDFPPRESTLGV